MPHAQIIEMCGVAKGVDERIEDLFGHIERMKNDRITKRVYAGKCLGAHLVDRTRKRWIGFLKLLKKRGLSNGQAGRTVYDRNEWWEYVKRNAWGIARGMSPWCYNCGLAQLC